MISKDLLLKCYEAASMQRWGEYARPVELDELGRQGQLLQVAFVIGACRWADTPLKWERLIDLALIRFFRRLAITDIQAPVFERLYGERRAELNAYVLEEMQRLIEDLPGGFPGRFARYLEAPIADERYAVERRALDAASALVAQWELEAILPVNQKSVWLPRARAQIEALVKKCGEQDSDGEVSALLGDPTFLEATGRLRIQRRWSRLATMPAFNVAGHCFVVALLAWEACVSDADAAEDIDPDEFDQRLANTVFGAVFHDIGESLTGDVIDPVKRGGGIQSLLKTVELEALERELWPHVPEAAAERLSDFARLEFSRGEVWGAPYDGDVIAMCDKLAAVAEIRVTMDNGVSSSSLRRVQTDIARSVDAALAAELISGD